MDTHKIHPTAVVDPKADLGRDVEIGAMAYVERDVRIGDGCWIGPRACILRYTTLGDRCRVHAGAVVGDLPQDLSYRDARSEVRVGAGTTIREGVTIHRGTKPDTVTEIGEGCFLMANSHVAHNARVGRQAILANGALLAGYVEVGDRAFISGNAVVHQFCRVGAIAMLGGLSGLSKDLPPYCIVRPLTANRVLRVNVVGLKRAGFTPQEREQVEQAFRILYRSNLNVSQALDRLRSLFPSGPVLEVIRFIETSERGICGSEGEEDF